MRPVVIRARLLRLLALAALVLLPHPLRAQVPQLINYQGRVAVSGVNFSGTGQFRFALVNAAGTTTYWSNDGSSNNGSQPTNAVSLPVTNGLYSVLLGDASIPNMTAVPGVIFNNPDVRLRVWFSDGTANGIQLLSPDQRIAAVGYALMADGVKAGGVSSAMIAAGAVGPAQLAGGAAAANLAASGQTGVASGGLVLSPASGSAALLAAGYVRIGSIPLGESWQRRAIGGAPAARTGHTAVWTGSEIIVWGGTDGNASLEDAARYNPATDTWTYLDAFLIARSGHTAVWTGTQMILWGGYSTITSTYRADGARYNPATDQWFPMTSSGAPAARAGHTAVWTGTQMIVWGGSNATSTLGDGARYNPSSNAWTSLATATGTPPSARIQHTAVWTGAEMIIFGGASGGAALAGGARYNLSSNAWASLATATGNAPGPRSRHTAVWTGTEMIIFGGDNNGLAWDTGSRYSPSANAWIDLPTGGTTPSPSARRDHTAVWTGTEMIIFGGLGSALPLADGSRYSAAFPLLWAALPATGTPPGRSRHTAVWTGSEMLVFGGASASSPLGDLWSYASSREVYLYQSP